MPDPRGAGTLSHLKCFTESAVPPIRLFLMIIIMPLKRCVAKENYLIALSRNEARIFFDVSALTLYSSTPAIVLFCPQMALLLSFLLILLCQVSQMNFEVNNICLVKKIYISIVFNQFKECPLLFMQIYIMSNNGLSWPQLWKHVL